MTTDADTIWVEAPPPPEIWRSGYARIVDLGSDVEMNRADVVLKSSASDSPSSASGNEVVEMTPNMSQPLWQVREYDATQDAAMVVEWARSRGKNLELQFLPPFGLIVELDGEPVAATWMFLCGRIGIIDKILMPPGLGIGVIPRAAQQCLDALKAVSKEQGIGAMMAYVPGNASTTLIKAGGHILGSGLVHVLFQV